MAYRASIIKSIQYGGTTLGAGATSGTTTITSVNVTNAAFVQWIGSAPVGAGAFDASMLPGFVSLTNATTVTASRIASGVAITIRWVVVEYYPNVIKSIQEFTILGTVTTATISAVVVAKTELKLRGFNTLNAQSAVQSWLADLTLTNTTTVTKTDNAVNNVYGVAVEFK